MIVKRVVIRTVATLVSAPIAFYLGFIVAGMAYQHWCEPRLIKESPHDGQIGLSAFVMALYGGSACAVVVLAFGTYWTIKAIQRSRVQ